MASKRPQKDGDETTSTPARRPLCFVIGPIGKPGTPTRNRSDFLLDGIIRQVLQSDEFGYEVRRADEDARPGMISDRVIHDVQEAELVIADLSDLNANAFYELAIRHLTEKPTIHVTNDIASLPFDNIGHAAILFDITTWPGVLAARASLAASVRATRAEDFKISNPITQANALFKPKGSADLPADLLIDLRDRIRQIERVIDSRAFARGVSFSSTPPLNRDTVAPGVISELLLAIANANCENASQAAMAGLTFFPRGGANCTSAQNSENEVTFFITDGTHIRIKIANFPPTLNDLTVELVRV